MNKKTLLCLLVAEILSGCASNQYVSRSNFQKNSSEHFITSYNTVKPVTEGILTWVKSTKPENPDPAITFTPTVEYEGKKYLYYDTNGLFNDSAAFFTNANGQPDGDKLTTSSEEQVGALTSSLIQLAAKAAGAISGITPNAMLLTPQRPSLSPCNSNSTIADISGFSIKISTNQTPNPIDIYGFNKTGTDPVSGKDKLERCIYSDHINYTIETPFKDPTTLAVNCEFDPKIDDKCGFLVYDSAPAVIKLKKDDGTVIWSNTFETYARSHWEKPERGFWTKPSDTYSLKGGVLIGHSYTQQSPIKTVVDFIFAPIQMAMPGVTQSTTKTSSSDKPTTTQSSSGLTFK